MLLILSLIMPLIGSVLLLMALDNLVHLMIPFAFWLVYILSTVSMTLLWNSKLEWNTSNLIQFLHHKYPKLEYSLSIFFKADSNSLEKLQQSIVFKHLPSVANIAFPVPLRTGFIFLIFSSLFYIYSFYYPGNTPSKDQPLTDKNKVKLLDDSIHHEQIRKFDYQLIVYPPNYTRLRKFQWEKDKKIAEGSKLFFRNKGNIDFQLLWQNNDRFDIKENQSKSFSLNQSSIFQIKYRIKDSAIALKPEVLEMRRDEAPILQTNKKENRFEIDWEDISKNFELDLSIQDDYGIISTDIIMTLSRGEGESVRFREMKQAIRGISKRLRKQQVEINIPLDTFSLEPGDELYFYFSAADNKTPNPNKGRTDVYFLSIADTVENEPVAYEGFALTNEAEYFKSQRQIIIDTEKLLKEQNQISKDEFDERSNSIGADQKMLRLRYGVFLGEEYETKGGLGEIDHSGHDHGNLEKDDDQEEEEGHDHEEHEAEGNFSNPIYNETPELEAYVHAHDESELSTFLDANVKAKLKEALANMWEAELFLRTYKPKEALPFEYKALKLIKEVKRASRIYVERMGFEPPPIDEGTKRLTGELDEINAQTIKDEIQEKSFQDQLSETYTKLTSAYYSKDLKSSEKILDGFTENLVLKITSEPVRYGKLLAGIKQFQYRKSINELEPILIMIEEILSPEAIDNGNEDKSIRSSLHKTYYELDND